MGWDAFSSVVIDFNNNKIEDPVLEKAFNEASEFVRNKTYSVDGLLYSGGLDCSDCAHMLEKATSFDCWDDDGWSADSVKELHQNANWNFNYDKQLEWAYWSAKKFLEVCANNNLSISFSY